MILKAETVERIKPVNEKQLNWGLVTIVEARKCLRKERIVHHTPLIIVHGLDKTLNTVLKTG